MVRQTTPGTEQELPTVCIVGLGPAGPGLRTVATNEALSSGAPVVVRTARHPGAAELVTLGAIALDGCYEEAATFEEAYAAITEAVVEAAARSGRVVYAVPGSPVVLERTVQLLRADPRVQVEVLPALSFLELAFDRLDIDPVTAHVRLVDASTFAIDAAGDPGPFLVAQTWSKLGLSELKLALETPPETPVTLLHHLGLEDERICEVPWSELDRTLEADHLTCCYIPKLAAPVAAELARLIELVAVLRERCPWDAKQTHQSLERHLLEETYEAIEAIEELGPEPDATSAAHLEEELGDVLVQVLFHARLAAEEGLFGLEDVARTCHDKLVHRHPHVFGEVTDVHTPEAVAARWEEIKQAEKQRESLMDGIPPALPALALIGKIERKADGVGLGIGDTGRTADGLTELLSAFLAGDDGDVGGLLVEITRLATARGLEPEEAARSAAAELRRRFVRSEQLAAASGTSLRAATETERQGFWARAQSDGESLLADTT